jgi:hypothetical protein
MKSTLSVVLLAAGSAVAQQAPVDCGKLAEATAARDCYIEERARMLAPEAPGKPPEGPEIDAFVMKAKENLVRDFKDPSSAQFRSLFLAMSGAVPVLCGEVNGKNSYGAYVGFRQFYATSEAPTKQIREPGEDYSFTVMNSKMCGNKARDLN